jgi:undecaprenyl-diphosphatase
VIDFLYSLDKAVFLFINVTLSNPVGDVVWPIITEYDKLLSVRIVLFAVWLLLIIRGGSRGRTAALLLIPVIVLADTVSSKVLKELIARPRPCHEIDGVAIVQGIHALVPCGPGKSFPSSHAVNNFAVATVFSYYFRRLQWWFIGAASLVALSRPAVGVHYPSDILGGALIGSLLALIVVLAWEWMCRRWFTPPGVTTPHSSGAP